MSVEFKRKASRSRTDVRDTIDGCVVIVYDLFCFLWFRSRKVVATLVWVSLGHTKKNI